MLTLPTRELRIGDVVHASNGMRCEVIEPPVRSTSHADRAGGCYFTRAVVINRDDITDHAVPHSFTPRDDRGRARWTLQGNDLVRWSVISRDVDREYVEHRDGLAPGGR